MAGLTDYQRDVLIRTALGEARGEGNQGMAAVLHTINNRANSGRYSNDPARVALQPSQYSTWNKGAGGNNPSQFNPGSKEYQNAAALVDQVFNGSYPDPTGGAMFYHTNSISPYWSKSVNTNGTMKLGNHTFYPTGNSVASQLDTGSPWPATPSARMEILRNASLGGQLAMNPIRGAGVPNMNAPQPASQSLALASARAAQAANTSPALKAALNARYGSTLPAIAPPRASVAPIAPIQPRTQTPAPSARSNIQMQRDEQAAMRGNTNQQLRSGLNGNTTPTQAQVNEMYAGGAVFPKPLDYVPPRVAPAPATMSADMQMMRNSPLNNTPRAPIPATMSASLAQSRLPVGNIAPVPANMSAQLQMNRTVPMGGPVPGPMPMMQSANMMLARDPAMMGLMPQALIPQGNPIMQSMARPAVGTVLGLGANGGGVVQGRNGLLNSTTQSSDYWQQAIGGGYGGNAGPSSTESGNAGTARKASRHSLWK